MEKKTYRVTFMADLTEDDVRAMNKCFYDAMNESMGIEQLWELKLEEIKFDGEPNQDCEQISLFDYDLDESQEVNDYIINVGHDEDNLTPFDSAHTYEEGIEKCEKHFEDWEFIELVYMPQENDDINVVVWFKSRI